MNETLCILTGASRGLGAALAEQLLAPGVTLLALSRREHPRLAELASAAGASCEQWSVDLAEPLAAAALDAWLGAFDAQRFATATLINNAAALARAGPLEASDPEDLSRALRVGLEAPLLLTAAFLRGTQNWRAERRLLNISSGLGRYAMAGQAAYCAVKAGLDHASRVIALDAAGQARGVKVVSLAPGVVDTDMQTQLRESDPAGFPDRDRFVELKSQGRLDTPAEAAAKVLRCLQGSDFGREPVADVRGA
ncbi:MAG: SDR family NAD(P)-dependent oxidoreductase [Methylibium sp.]|uniref:SDR family NAD(P)-dependent oxidoreductase n=1 Tax=Methylibium sp. TaxID=2067992 RepID=UPI0017D93BA9|nr:SDR family NAD(P)-dependent oxidoreductase [Methylibium sp.]MBA3596061.1 SDR family NAD(P)-dependent oxidoreductase [Methylibium sp.]